MSERVCPGCGGPLPSQHHKRKWCSERCRKKSYGDPCVDCGERTTFGADHARVPEPRCKPCAQVHRHKPMHQQLEQMWASGMSLRAIGEVFGWTVGSTAAQISNFRSRGYNLPYRNRGAAAYQAFHGAEAMAFARSKRVAA